MVSERTNEPDKSKKRFTVSLEKGDYERLADIARSHRPPLTLQYVVQYAVQILLEKSADPKFDFDIGDPFPPTKVPEDA